MPCVSRVQCHVGILSVSCGSRVQWHGFFQEPWSTIGLLGLRAHNRYRASIRPHPDTIIQYTHIRPSDHTVHPHMVI